jgi:hypothetical protein
VGLRFVDFTLFLRDGTGNHAAEKKLVGVNLDDGLSWLIAAIAEHTGDSPPDLKLAEHEMPEHPLRSGEPFSPRPTAQLEELARWFANGDRVLQGVSADNPGALAVQIWPHHFDPSVVIKLAPGSGAEDARGVTVGMSPGDSSYAEPYYYVLCYPFPEGAALPDLEGGGRWHVAGWTGAVLTGVNAASAEDQARQVEAFVSSAISASKALLDA